MPAIDQEARPVTEHSARLRRFQERVYLEFDAEGLEALAAEQGDEFVVQLGALFVRGQRSARGKYSRIYLFADQDEIDFDAAIEVRIRRIEGPKREHQIQPREHVRHRRFTEPDGLHAER